MSDKKQGIPHITCEHFLGMHGHPDREHVVVDLRDALEFESGHITDSLNVPKKELAENIETAVPDKVQKIIAIVGPTQEEELQKIYALLKEKGYKDVEFLAGGFDRYCEIADIELEPDLTELTPEEEGFTSHEEIADTDPHKSENEPLY